jgi:hypothetical protein
MYICVYNASMYICIYVYMYICVRVHACLCVCVCVCVCVGESLQRHSSKGATLSCFRCAVYTSIDRRIDIISFFFRARPSHISGVLMLNCVLCVCPRACACVRARVRACVRACVRA